MCFLCRGRDRDGTNVINRELKAKGRLVREVVECTRHSDRDDKGNQRKDRNREYN